MVEESPSNDPLRLQAALLLAQARAQSLDLQRALGSIGGGDASLKSRLIAAATHSAEVAGALSTALQASSFPLRAGDLLALDAAVNSGEASALVSEASAQAGGEAAKAAAALVTATAAETRAEVQNVGSDLFERKIFEPYLHFASREDEDGFRKRQAEAETYIKAQLARHTAEGDLNAGGGAAGAMLDAGAHGASDSPDFLPRWNKLVATTERQRAAMRAAGQSTDEYDHTVTTSVRGFLKARGLSEAEIDQRLAASANPLDAVQPFLKDDGASRGMMNHLNRDAEPVASFPPSSHVAADAPVSLRDAPQSIDLVAMAAKLKTTVLHSAEPADDAPTHGLTMAKPGGNALPGFGG